MSATYPIGPRRYIATERAPLPSHASVESPPMQIHGDVAPGFERVADTFLDNFTHRGEVGAAFAVYRRGEIVVDLWAGAADPETGRPWKRETPGVVFSSTKGMVAAVMLMLAERGELDIDAPLADTVWPELGTAGKERVTARMILNHRAGLSAIDAPLTVEDFGTSPERVHDALVSQVPMWEPDTDQGYAACSYGAYTAEIVRRVTDQSVGSWFAEHIAAPLDLNCWIGLDPARFPEVSRLLPVPTAQRLKSVVPSALFRRTSEGRLFRRVLHEVATKSGRTYAGRAFLNPTLGPRAFEALNDADKLALELPWMGGVSTARSLSRMYAALVSEVDGVRLVRAETLNPVRHRQSWAERDRVLHRAMGWSQGFVKEDKNVFGPNPSSFGHPGAGGALGWADPDGEIAIGYVMNQMDWRLRSPRAIALCDAVYASL